MTEASALVPARPAKPRVPALRSGAQPAPIEKAAMILTAIGPDLAAFSIGAGWAPLRSAGTRGFAGLAGTRAEASVMRRSSGPWRRRAGSSRRR